MIEKLDIKNGGVEDLLNCIKKINEVIDVINTIQKEREAERFEIQEWIGIIESVRESVNAYKKQIGELQQAFKSIHQYLKYKDLIKRQDDPYVEQRKWVGKLCRFWDDDYKTIKHFGILASINEREFCKYEADNGNYFCACEPVKPDDDIIYKGE